MFQNCFTAFHNLWSWSIIAFAQAAITPVWQDIQFSVFAYKKRNSDSFCALVLFVQVKRHCCICEWCAAGAAPGFQFWMDLLITEVTLRDIELKMIPALLVSLPFTALSNIVWIFLCYVRQDWYKLIAAHCIWLWLNTITHACTTTTSTGFPKILIHDKFHLVVMQAQHTNPNWADVTPWDVCPLLRWCSWHHNSISLLWLSFLLVLVCSRCLAAHNYKAVVSVSKLAIGIIFSKVKLDTARSGTFCLCHFQLVGLMQR